MRPLHALVPWLLLVAGSVSEPARAASPSSAVVLPQAGLLGVSDSIRLKLLASLARGDIAGAIVMYEAQTGHAAPAWLLELQVAYSVVSQNVGRCQEVARIIHSAFTRLGQNPQYVVIRALDRKNYITFDMADGKVPTLTRNGYHVIVKLEDIVYDAYTGSAGMKLTQYLSQLHAEAGVTWQVVAAP